METSDLYNKIEKNSNLNKNELYEKLILMFPKNKVDFIMYDLFKYIYTKQDEKKRRMNQDTFREDLINRYKCCLITGCNQIVCEACHIIPFKDCTDDIKYNVNNGLLLRVDLHKLFDNGNLKINPDTSQIELSKDVLNDNTMKDYHKYNNKKINIHEKSICFLKS